jgi:hypothetical protein
MMKKIFLATIATIALASVSASIDAAATSFFTPNNQINTTFSIQNNYGYPLYVKVIKPKARTNKEESVTLNSGDRIPCGNLCLYEAGAIELLISTRTSPTYTDLDRFIQPYLSQLRGKKHAVITINPSGVREDWKISVGYED